MRTPSKETIEALRRAYPAGCTVELVRMDDPQAPPGDRTAAGGSIMTEKVKEQILAIRDTGLTNMFDLPMVQRLAYDRGYYELVIYLEEHRKEYARFILTGEAETEG